MDLDTDGSVLGHIFTFHLPYSGDHSHTWDEDRGHDDEGVDEDGVSDVEDGGGFGVNCLGT